ncbi:hypothetical protein Q4E93_32135 [Flavitalea sp. BT771]|uniref:hypothetical protein n=1 Tax=Flavitalea sp. BT771 TaxID=3063329 RepID=UPI0026E3F151|nr:hypothetical protein [Flavitalea sp. BT771]MDO6435310.1 hypothetical protein [Flavitalea sp. BT771]MDV6224330.1 hypothetical protein [Flavitalea sp. BT771]
MNGKRFVLPVLAASFVAAVVLTRCEGGRPKSGTQDSTSTSNHLNSPAPDNNSATNPSVADTAFQKDTGRIKRDSSR